jgi:ureidoacrylate peracid hydrolase
MSKELLLDLQSKVAPKHTALLVIDMQNDFCAPGGWTDTVVKKSVAGCAPVAGHINTLSAAARASKVPVFWVQADYSDDKVPEPMLARSRRTGMNAVCCAPGTWGAEWFEMQPQPGEPVITKHCYSGFMGTDLDAQLKRRGIRTLVLTGVQTHVCVESTLRDAHSLGYYCVVPEECVASHTPAAHDVTLTNTRFLFGEVARSEEVMQAWIGA